MTAFGKMNYSDAVRSLRSEKSLRFPLAGDLAGDMGASLFGFARDGVCGACRPGCPERFSTGAELSSMPAYRLCTLKGYCAIRWLIYNVKLSLWRFRSHQLGFRHPQAAKKLSQR